MGTSLPYGRALCHSLRSQQSPNIPVVITGDGAFHFQVNDLIHYQRDKLFVIIILMNNQIFHLGKNGTSEIYNSNKYEFSVDLLARPGGQSFICRTANEFKSIFLSCAAKKSGINIIEVKTSTAPEDLRKEIQLLNLYMAANLGLADAVAKWDDLKTDAGRAIGRQMPSKWLGCVTTKVKYSADEK